MRAVSQRSCPELPVCIRWMSPVDAPGSAANACPSRHASRRPVPAGPQPPAARLLGRSPPSPAPAADRPGPISRAVRSVTACPSPCEDSPPQLVRLHLGSLHPRPRQAGPACPAQRRATATFPMHGCPPCVGSAARSCAPLGAGTIRRRRTPSPSGLPVLLTRIGPAKPDGTSRSPSPGAAWPGGSR